LEHFGRVGVPLYLFYPGHGEKPRILPQLLTTGIVLDAIKTAEPVNAQAASGA
jgi:thiol:disulfide interchange protein DsbD